MCMEGNTKLKLKLRGVSPAELVFGHVLRDGVTPVAFEATDEQKEVTSYMRGRRQEQVRDQEEERRQ